MNNFVLAINVITPSFLFIALGAILKKIGLLNEDGLNCLNKISFKVFLPVLLLWNVYSTDLSQAFNWKLLVFCISAVLIIWILGFLIVPLIEKNNENRGIIIQSLYRSNFILFGVPIISSLYVGADLGSTALTMAIVVPLFNLTSVISFEAFKGEKFRVKNALKGIILNPLILGTLIGLFLLLIKVKLPSAIATPIATISDLASPIALIMLGGSFKFAKVKNNWKQLLSVLSFKMVLMPLIVITIAIALNFRGMELATIMVFTVAPTAVASYPMALEMKGNAELASELIIFGSLISVVTMFAWVMSLSAFGLL